MIEHHRVAQVVHAQRFDVNGKIGSGLFQIANHHTRSDCVNRAIGKTETLEIPHTVQVFQRVRASPEIGHPLLQLLHEERSIYHGMNSMLLGKVFGNKHFFGVRDAEALAPRVSACQYRLRSDHRWRGRTRPVPTWSPFGAIATT